MLIVSKCQQFEMRPAVCCRLTRRWPNSANERCERKAPPGRSALSRRVRLSRLYRTDLVDYAEARAQGAAAVAPWLPVSISTKVSVFVGLRQTY
jgi:hypothetical protein